MVKLTQYEFEWILPGHGRRYHSDPHTIRQQITECIVWMKQRRKNDELEGLSIV